MNHMRITTCELAKLCNVSQGTVDRALNHRGGIRESTRRRIIETAEQYGYRALNRKEKSGPKMIGFVVFNLKNEYFTKLITDLEEALKESGHLLTVMFTNYDKQAEIDAIRHLYTMGAEGIVLCPVNNDAVFDNFLKQLNIPIVAVGNQISSVPYVGIDDFAAMEEYTQKILGKGFTHLVYYSPALLYDDAYAQKRRYEGFLSAVKDLTPYTVVTDIANIKDVYDENTAIICSTDYYAMQVYLKAKNCTVFGFDGIDMVRKFCLPISSARYSTREIAQNVVDVLLNRKTADVIVPHDLSGV